MVSKLFLDYSEKAFEEENERRNIVDNKTAMFMELDGVILGVLYFVYQNYSSIPTQYQTSANLIVSVSSAFLAISLVLCVITVSIVKYVVAPDPRKLYNKYSTKTETKVERELTAVFTEAFEENMKTNNKKMEILNLAIISTITGMFVLMIGLFFWVVKVNGWL